MTQPATRILTVVEHWPGLRRGGQVVDLHGVAGEVLRRIGLDTQVRPPAPAGASFVTGGNRRLATVRAGRFGGDGRITELEVLRGRLAQVLLRRGEGRRGVPVRRPH